MADYEDPKDLFRDAFGTRFVENYGEEKEVFEYQLPDEEITGTLVPVEAAVERYEEPLTDTEKSPEERLAAARDAAADDGNAFFANMYSDAKRNL